MLALLPGVSKTPSVSFSAYPPVPHEQPNGAVGAPFAVVQPIAESKRDDPTHRESKTENENRNHAEGF